MRKASTPPDSNPDAEHFRAAMRDVTPLRSEARVTPVPARARRKSARAGAAAATGAGRLPPLADADTTPDESLTFRRPGVQDQALKKLRRGLIPCQAQIDLHGLTQQQAWDFLSDFISDSRARSFRCVRVVHGKGYRSGARGPVLKSAVNTWLRRNHDVVAFVSARAIDGGAGALYVLLRA